MKYQAYKRPDGKEELRLKPESERDCNEIEDCSHCFFDDDHTCEDEAGVKNHIENIESRMFDPSVEFGITPEMMQRQQKPTFEEVLRQFGFSGIIPQSMPNLNLTNVDVRLFAIENGKVITDPETRELMRQAGILEKIEKSFEEEDDN